MHVCRIGLWREIISSVFFLWTSLFWDYGNFFLSAPENFSINIIYVLSESVQCWVISWEFYAIYVTHKMMLTMGTDSLLPNIIFGCIWLMHSYFANGCQLKYINSALTEYRCVSEGDNNVELRQMDIHKCVWKCLMLSTCRYINHNQSAGQCVLGLSMCENLQPAPGFWVQAFGPAGHSCLSWGSKDEPDHVPVQMNDGHEIIYISRWIQGNTLIPGKYTTEGRTFWCSNEGDRVSQNSLDDVNVLTTNPACTLSWMPYTSGAPIPTEAVIGGHLADNTKLYVARVDNVVNNRLAFGYYNPRSEKAHCELGGVHIATVLHLLISL